MAAKDQPGKSTKMVWRSCLKCPTRLSELCYDTHTLCETCRNKVCDFNSFCEECESWTPEFRKLYLRNKRTLYLKRVSKKNKSKSPPQVDDAASAASQESVVSPPVVLLPLDPQLVDANLSLEELQNIQHVDNVVEVQFQPVSTTPPPTTVAFDAGLMNSAFEKINNMMEVFKEFGPLLRDLGSARRSPTAGSSDIGRPNPIDRFSDTAPQGPVVAPQSPDVAPGPSSASFDPHASGSSRHDDLRDDKFASPRGGLDKGEHVHVGIRHVSPPASPSHQDRLREELESVHTQISHIREITDFCRARGRAPPDQSQDDLEILQSKYAQLSVALEELLYASSSHRRGLSPAFTSHRVVSPSDAHPLRPDSSSLHGPRLSTRPRSPSQDRSRSRDDYSGHSRRSQERYVERFGSSAAPSHGRRPRSRGSPSPKRLEFSRESPSQHEMRFASTSPLRNTRCDSHPRVPFATRDAIRITKVTFATRVAIRNKRVSLSKANGIRIKSVTLSKANGIRF